MYATVIVKRGRKNSIVYNSGKIYLSERSSVEVFLDEAEKRGLEAYEIRLKSPLYEPGDSKGDGYFCPYCGNWEFWIRKDDTKHCPICGISDHDYYVKKANNLWSRGMSSKSTQKQRARARRKNNGNNL